MRIAVTRADQEVARLDVLLADRLGEDVDPRVRLIADADLDIGRRTQDQWPTDPDRQVIWLDGQTGEVVAVSVAAAGTVITPAGSPSVGA